MSRCSQARSSLIAGKPATPAITMNFGTALGTSCLTGPGTALGTSFLPGPGTALGTSCLVGPGTALGTSASAGDAAHTKAMVPKISVLYEVIIHGSDRAFKASSGYTAFPYAIVPANAL